MIIIIIILSSLYGKCRYGVDVDWVQYALLCGWVQFERAQDPFYSLHHRRVKVPADPLSIIKIFFEFNLFINNVFNQGASR